MGADGGDAYQVDDANGVSLVFGTLGEEQQPFAGLTSPRCRGVLRIILVRSQESGQ